MLLSILLGLELTAQSEDLPRVDFSRLEDAVRLQIQDARNFAQPLIRQADLPPGLRAEAWGSLAKIYHVYNFSAAAEASYRRALALAPGDVRWNYLLGRLLQENYEDPDAPERALAALRKARQLDPDNPYVLSSLATVLLDTSALEEAESVLDRALRVAPDEAVILALRGRLAVARDAPDEAIRFYRRALEVQPSADRLHYPLGMAYRALGDMDRARVHLNRSGRNSPSMSNPLLQELMSLRRGARVHQLSGMVAANAGRYDAAAVEFGKAVEANPEDPRAYLNLATALILDNQREAGFTTYRRGLELDPSHWLLNYNYGSLLAESGDDEEAVAYLQRAVAGNARNRDAHFGLAHCLMRLDRPAEATDAYRQVLEIDPHSQAGRYWLGIAAAAAGQWTLARDSFQAVLNSNPGRVEAAAALARLLAAAPEPDLRNPRAALDLARRLYQAVASLDHGAVLALALAANGEFEQASQLQGQLVEAAQANELPRLVEAYTDHQAMYLRRQMPISPWPEGDPVFHPAPSLRLHLGGLTPDS